jgi:hypothetical protein
LEIPLGGNALAHLGVVRVDSGQVAIVYNRIQRQLLLSGLGIHAYLVPWIEDKITHGDIDLLVECSGPQAIIEALHITGSQWYSINGNVISVAVPIYNDPARWDSRVQVDFICIQESVAHHRLYYSGGDFGLLLGRVAAWNGFTFAQEGLRLRHCPELGTDQDILLTTDPVESLTMLGYFDQPPGFSTYEDMWSWVLCSRMAHPDMFLPESTNAENRSRDKQRPMVEKFQKWLVTQPRDRPCHLRMNGEERFALLPPRHQKWVDEKLTERQRELDVQHAITDCFGMGAVKKAIGIEGEQAGPIIRAMQPLLPTKVGRRLLYIQSKETAALLAVLAAKVAHANLLSTPSASP